MAKRQSRIDTAQTAAETAEVALHAVQAPLKPLACTPLRPQDEPFWELVMRARAREEWGRIELALAAQLARVMADIETEQETLNGESMVIKTDKGWPATNPRAGTINVLSMRQFKLMTMLKIAGAVVGDSEEYVPRRKAEREAENTIRRLKRGEQETAGTGGDEPSLLSL